MTLIARPRNVADITKGLAAMLRAWPGIMDREAHVERSEKLNELPGNCPWIGVYRDSVAFRSRTVGYGSGFRDQVVTLVVAVQQANPKSGEDCEGELEALLAEVVAAILTDVTLGGTVHMVEELAVRYADYSKVGDNFMQTAGVYLTASVPVTVTEV